MAEKDVITAPVAQPSEVRRLITTHTSERLPVESRVFQSVHEVNTGFEKLVHDMEALQGIEFFPHEKLTVHIHILCRIQAETNFALMERIRQREQENALYFDRLCIRWEREIRDPDDVSIEAEHRKQELEQERERQEQEPQTAEI